MMSTYAKRGLSMLGVLVGLLAATYVHASSFTVSPTRIPLSAKQRAITVRLLNTGEQTVVVQAHVVAWTLRENEDVYQDTDDVLLNPPIFTLNPDKPQLMRLGLRRPRADGTEIAYRLIVEEVPPAPIHGVMQLRTVLRISVPIFVEQLGEARKQLDWKAEPVSGGIKVTATNLGNKHVQIKRLDLSPEGSTVAPSIKKLLDYLLPGKTREWIFDEESIRAAPKLSLNADTDAGKLSVSMVPTTR